MSARQPPSDLTASQHAAVTARGNVLVMAGAGTGKTHTLIQRCLDCLHSDGAGLDEILIVTFTEAAAAEMRHRLRQALEENARAGAAGQRALEQLALFDAAHIGTLHSFCLKLAREHFYELGLDPDLAVLETSEAHALAQETLEAQLQGHYAGETEFDLAVQNLIQTHGGGRDEPIRALILRLHHYAQTRPDAAGWLAAQSAHFAESAPRVWQAWLMESIREWLAGWHPQLAQLAAENSKAAEFLNLISLLPEPLTREAATTLLEAIQVRGEVWPKGQKTVLQKPLKPFLEEAEFFLSVAQIKNGADPLADDWSWIRGQMSTLVRLARDFEQAFSQAKLQDGAADFHDLEQFALKLLWDFAADQPALIARHWREKLRFVFVDEYQDINAAQDKIIQALGGAEGSPNRFLVGDVKQSIYRFRQADPRIFREYARQWRDGSGQALALSENFRSREGLLHFVNSLFAPLMREEVGGVQYDEDARLKFGSRSERGPLAMDPSSPPRVEIVLLKKGGAESAAEGEAGLEAVAELETAEKEARLLAGRLVRLHEQRSPVWDLASAAFRPVEWRDMAVLLRAPGGKAEIYAREFERAGIPLVVERGGFYECAEIADLLSVLQLLDNPLQDLPAIAVLRSPLVGLSLEELAQIRLTADRAHFWTALNRSRDVGSHIAEETRRRITEFLHRFAAWRQLARQAPLLPCLETVLVETDYLEWLGTQPRGAQRQANVRRFLALAEQFDQFQRQGLHRFLKFIEAQREAATEPEVVPALAENAARLMSIHQSKGLEFPVVALADLAKNFNTNDIRAEIIFDETFGLCPRVKPPNSGRRYPSLPHWLACRHQKRELAGEELRLLYVALTRARDTLLMVGNVTEKKWEAAWHTPAPISAQAILAAKSHADWVARWFANHDHEKTPLVNCQLVEESELAVSVHAAPISATWESAEAAALPYLDQPTQARLEFALNWRYEFAAATEYKAKTSATALRRQATDNLEGEEAQPLYPPASGQRFVLDGGSGKLSASDTGTAHHIFLQYLRLDQAGSESSLSAEAVRLAGLNLLSEDERRALNLPAVAAFWNSTIGREIRAQSAFVHRELEFTARFSPDELAAITALPAPCAAGELAGEFVVIQGVADLVVRLPAEIWLVDFKTDHLIKGELAQKTAHYQPQIQLYASALAKIYGIPVTRRWLHYLALRETAAV